MSETEIVVALVNRAAGNASIGTEWTETGLFAPETTLAEVLAWAKPLDASTSDVRIRYADDRRAVPTNPSDKAKV
jgi:hypothetical protein